MNNRFILKLDIDGVADFVKAASSISNDVVLEQGQSRVDGKSLMGVYSLDLSKDIVLILDNSNSISTIISIFGKWIYNIQSNKYKGGNV